MTLETLTGKTSVRRSEYMTMLLAAGAAAVMHGASRAGQGRCTVNCDVSFALVAGVLAGIVAFMLLTIFIAIRAGGGDEE